MGTRTNLIAAALLVAVSGGVTGCNTTERERTRDKTLRQAESLQRRLSVMPEFIDDAVTQLTATTSPGTVDRQAAYNRFSASLSRMRESATEVGQDYQRALTDSAAFFQEWSRSGRTLSPEERLKLEQEIGGQMAGREDAIKYFESARNNYLRLVNDMESVKTSLAGNLSDQNVAAVRPQVERIIREAYNVRLYVDRLDEVLTKAVSLR